MIRGERVLFREVCVAVRAGDALLLRGANGAGKTTLLRVLAGLTRPEAGRVTRAAAHHWVGHREGLKPQETPREHLKLWTQAWGSGAETDPVLTRMGLTRPADVAGRYLSAGQRRRTALARLLFAGGERHVTAQRAIAVESQTRCMMGAHGGRPDPHRLAAALARGNAAMLLRFAGPRLRPWPSLCQPRGGSRRRGV